MSFCCHVVLRQGLRCAGGNAAAFLPQIKQPWVSHTGFQPNFAILHFMLLRMEVFDLKQLFLFEKGACFLGKMDSILGFWNKSGMNLPIV